MSPRVQVVGSYLSPYVRKVLACLDLKGLDYEIDPIGAFHGRRSIHRVALRRIPLLITDRPRRACCEPRPPRGACVRACGCRAQA